MKKVALVAAREFIETIKTRAFLFSVVLMPIVIIALIFLAESIRRSLDRDVLPLRTIAVVDETGAVLPELAAQVDRYNVEQPQRPFAVTPVVAREPDLDSLRAAVNRGELYAYLLIPTGAVDGGAPCVLARKDSRLEAWERIHQMLQTAIVNVRFRQHDPPIDAATVMRLQAPVALRGVDAATGEVAREDMFARVMMPFAFMFLLFMGVMAVSQGLLTSVIEEKSSRIIEVLLSAVSPLQLMAGKILGMAAVGGLLLVVWGAVGFFGARARGMEQLVPLYRLTYAAIYFVPAFLLYASFLAGIGSACNTLKEAQSMAFPMSIFTLIPLLTWLPISQNPTSLLSIVLSYIPPITPFIMIVRICADPDTPWVQIIASLVLLWLSVAAAIWAAAKVFRVGVLMYGKPPTPRELLRWLRAA